MKIQIFLNIIIILVMSVSASYAEWTKVTKNIKGDTLYVDFEKMRKHDGYLYWWYLVDYHKPIKHGIWSLKAYIQSDCLEFRYKIFANFPYKKPMGEGVASSSNKKPDKEWRYPPINSSTKKILNTICKH